MFVLWSPSPELSSLSSFSFNYCRPGDDGGEWWLGGSAGVKNIEEEEVCCCGKWATGRQADDRPIYAVPSLKVYRSAQNTGKKKLNHHALKMMHPFFYPLSNIMNWICRTCAKEIAFHHEFWYCNVPKPSLLKMVSATTSLTRSILAALTVVPA